MKSMLVVIDDKKSAKVLLQKAMMFSPDVLQVLVLEENNTGVTHVISEQVRTIFDAIKNKTCQLNIISDVQNSAKENAERAIELAQEMNADGVVIVRNKRQGDSHDYVFEKAVLKGLSHSCLLLLSDQHWKAPYDVLGTLDINDESEQQAELNNVVLANAAELSTAIGANLHFVSVIAISKISSELDLVESSEVVVKKGKETKEKLNAYVGITNNSVNATTHVTAGVPHDEIPSFSKKIKADLVVLGNVGRTGLKGLVIGNTAEKILQRLSVDVVLIKQ